MEDRLTHQINDAAVEPGLWPDVLARISEQFDGASVFLCQAPLDRPYAGDAWAHGYDLNAFAAAPADLWAEGANPVMPFMTHAPVGAAFDRRCLIDDAMVDRHPIGRYFLVNQGLFHLVLAVAQRDAETATQVFLARGPRREAFAAQEAARFAELVGHVGRAMRTHRAVGQLAARAGGFAAALDRLATALVLLDGQLRIDHANAAAERIIEAGDGVRRFRGALRFENAAAQRQLEQAAHRLSGRSPGHADAAIRVPRRSRAAAFRVQVLPAPSDSTTALAPRSQIMVFIHDPEAALAAITPGRVAEHHGLTAAEARVAALAGRALGITEIAARLGVSTNTVKSHLKTVYGKLDVRTQAELVRLLMSRHPPIAGEQG